MPWASHKLRSGTTDSKIDARWWIATLVLVSPQQAEMTSLWWFRYIFPNTHAHVQLYVLATLIHGVTTLVCTGRLLAAAFNTRHTLAHTDPLFQLPLLSQLCLCLLKPQCTDDKLSQPGGWSSARRPPQAHRPSADFGHAGPSCHRPRTCGGGGDKHWFGTFHFDR